MIAVIEKADKVVWGFGPTAAAAMHNAQKEIRAFKDCNPGESIGDLEYATLRPEADLGSCGTGLWEWIVVSDGPTAVQQDMF